MFKTPEHKRLAEHHNRTANWKRWGPYLSERAWGTVREDYGQEANPWESLPYEHSRLTAYRWNEDGIAGISDRNQRLCFAIALWNEEDDHLKERLFGLTNPEGNHGEDVKENYWYVDSSPTHSHMKMIYHYPQAAFPYERLRAHGKKKKDRELELLDTGIFNENRFFEVSVTYAKDHQNDVLIAIEITNRGPEEAPLWLLPTLWFRNTWSWGDAPEGQTRPGLSEIAGPEGVRAVEARFRPDSRFTEATEDETFFWFAEGAEELIFTENDTNREALKRGANASPYVKDAFHRWACNVQEDAVNPEARGTKAAAVYRMRIPSLGTRRIRLRLVSPQKRPNGDDPRPERRIRSPFAYFDSTMTKRSAERERFFKSVLSAGLTDDERRVQYQALAGMMWNKQFYYYDVEKWLRGDAEHGEPKRHSKRNRTWSHLFNFDVISMPDKWEYPWYAVWDLAFHCIPISLVDVDFAKRQLLLFTREWYMHPNGQLPAYEWSFADVNPPVHPWAVWRVYRMQKEGNRDREFLEAAFHKLLLNFTWWVNRKDHGEKNIFQGGFLGLDNIGILDRSRPLEGVRIDQSDGTSWMAAYCLHMMRMALELARENPVYQDSATKFLEHFLRIAHAMTTIGKKGTGLWNEEDGFFYDLMHIEEEGNVREETVKVRSLVGLLPLFAVDTLEPGELDSNPVFRDRIRWLLRNRPHLTSNMTTMDTPEIGGRQLVALLTRERLERVLHRLLDAEEFLSDHGIRSMSRWHEKHPVELEIRGKKHSISYEPAESRDNLFGGNSNWRGPVWFPVNYLIIHALRRFHRFYGDELQVECPTGSGNLMSLEEVAHDLSRRLVKPFLRDQDGRRPVFGRQKKLQTDPHWGNLLVFPEYFHGDSGEGLGAMHQTGWTGLVANLLDETAGVE